MRGSAHGQSPSPSRESGPRSAEVGQATSSDIHETSPWCLLVPLGATEQHGPHLPLATDTIIAHQWALAAAQQLHGVVVAPPLPYGSSGEHQGFAGTISIGQEALTAVLVEIARSARSDYRGVLFVSGHGGNVPVLRTAVEQLHREGHLVDWISPQWTDQDVENHDLDRLDAHAGHSETSLMLHLCPEIVGPFDGVVGNKGPLSELMPVLQSQGLAAVTDTGVLGDPAGASPDHGKVLFAALVNQLIKAVQHLYDPKMRS